MDSKDLARSFSFEFLEDSPLSAFLDSRLDLFLSKSEDLDISRQYAQDLLKAGNVLVNNKTAKASYKLKEGDLLQIEIPAPEKLDILAEDIPLEIVYEDEDLIVVNKPINMVTHPAAGVSSGTLVNALMHHCGDSLSDINGVQRPGIVHRLDKDTSGLIIVAKNNKAHNSLAKQIQEKTLERRYQCIVQSNIKENSGFINRNIGRHPKHRHKMAVTDSSGRNALTKWWVKKRFDLGNNNLFCLVECKLETGRTHQIRVHMSWFRHPIVGDKTYGPEKVKYPFKVERPMLHSFKMSFVHPSSGETMSFEVPLPDDFQELLRKLGVE